MAFALKYRIAFKDILNSNSFRIEVHQDGWAGGVTDLGHTDTALNLSYNRDGAVIGSEVQFEFFAEQSETAALDADFFDAPYKTIKILYYENSNLKWAGWLKPENTFREYDGPQVTYQISATDGLNDLEDVPYSGYDTTGTRTLLQNILNALNFIGIDDLKLAIQCNIEETSIMTGGNVFNKIECNNKQFYENRDGEIVPDKCFTVLEKILKPFYCRIYQADGMWRIVNGQEYNTVYSSWALDGTPDVVDTPINRQYDISGGLRDENKPLELTKEPPVKWQRILFKNRNLGDSETFLNNDFEDGGNPPDGWTNSGWDSVQTFSDGVRKVAKTDEYSINADKKYIESSVIPISGVDTNSDSLIVSCEVKLKSLSFSSGNEVPKVYLELVLPNGSIQISGVHYLSNIDGDYTIISHEFPISNDGNYRVRLVCEPRSPLIQVTYYWDNVDIKHTGTANTTTDIMYRAESSVNAYVEQKMDIYFADSGQLSDIGALQVGGVLSETWKRYGKTESQSLVYLLAQQYLNDNKAFQDVLNINYYDENNSLTFNTIVILNGKTYRFVTFQKDYKTLKVTGEILQVDNSTDIAFTWDPIALTSVYGESTQSTASTTPTGYATQSWVNAKLEAYAEKAVDETITGSWIFSSGFTIGSTAVSEADVQNWNTAYGWGDHAAAGYAMAANITWTISDGTNSEAITSGDTLTIAGGTDISTTYDTATNTLTVAFTGSGGTVYNNLITLAAGTGLTGGGDFTVNQSFDETIIFNIDFAGTGTATTAARSDHTHNYDNYQSWTISDGTNSEAIASGDTLKILGGTDINTSYDSAANELTIAFTGSGGTVYNNTITLSAGSGLTGGGSFTVNQNTDGTITFNADFAGSGTANTIARSDHTHSYDNYSYWKVSDGTNTENVTSGFTLKFTGSGTVSTTYTASTNTLVITGAATTSSGSGGDVQLADGAGGFTSDALTFSSTSQVLTIGDITGGGGAGIAYIDGGGTSRYALRFENGVVYLSNRQADGEVHIMANTSTAGSTGERSAAHFTDQFVTLFYEGAQKLQTRTSGVLVTGTLNATTGLQINSQNLSITHLADVTISSPTSGEVLTYDGTKWVNSTSSGGTVYNSTITIAAGSGLLDGGDFTLNQSVDETINLRVAFGGNGVATTVSRSDHTHTYTLENITDNGNVSNNVIAIRGNDKIPGSGEGMELSYAPISGIAEVLAYDRTNSIYKQLNLTGVGVKVNYGSTNIISIPSTAGMAVKTTSITSGYALEVAGKIRCTDLTITSDEALKEDIRPVEKAAVIVDKMRPVTFKWKGDHKKKFGFIAQDILKVETIADTVVQGADGMLSLNQNDYIALAIAALKEQRNEIAELKQELKQLRNGFTK